MGIFMPPDITFRIKKFMAASVDFPFIRKDEVIAVFYLLGKEQGVAGEAEIRAATDIAKRTVQQSTKSIRLYGATPQKMDARFTRENYTKRSLQIVVESNAQSDV